MNAVDLFAGAGGWSHGWRMATGSEPLVAVNHCAHAVHLHTLNHPDTEHFLEDVWEVDPCKAIAGRSIDWLHASPDCTHFSRAKGGKPREQKIRGLAWVVVEWAKTARPRILSLENVAEFATWGPLDEQGHPIKSRAGETFREFVGKLESLGYTVDWRVLCAADFGAPTIRKRLFLVARNDGEPIVWPTPTHGKPESGGLFPAPVKPWRTAAECIDWDLPCPSIFERKKPLAEATCRRIAAGIARYVLGGDPFIVTMRGTSSSHLHGDSLHEPLRTVLAGGSHHALVAPFLAKHYGGVVGTSVKVPVGTVTKTDHHSLVTAHLTTIDHQSNANGGHSGAGTPLSTVTTKARHGVVAASLIQTGYGERKGQDPRTLDIRKPLGTIVAGGSKHALVAAFLTTYYSQGGTANRLDVPAPTVVTKARHGLVTIEIEGEQYAIADIGMRMLQPRELARAQGFPDSYVLEGTKTEQIARIGNSVCPQVAAAIVRANLATNVRVA